MTMNGQLQKSISEAQNPLPQIFSTAKYYQFDPPKLSHTNYCLQGEAKNLTIFSKLA